MDKREAKAYVENFLDELLDSPQAQALFIDSSLEMGSYETFLAAVRVIASKNKSALSRQIGMSRAQIDNLINQKHSPRQDTLERLADAFGYKMVFIRKDRYESSLQEG